MTDYPKIQETMDSAYKGYTDTMSLKDFYASLDPWTRSVVAFGNLNYQVENGGFLQWHDNGYSVGLNAIKSLLGRLATPEANEVAQLVQKAYKCLDEQAKRSRSWDEDDDDDSEPLGLNAMDTAFYALAPKVLAQIEAGLGT